MMDGKERSLWHVLFPVSLGTALSLMGDSALYTVLPVYTAEAGVLLASVGILLSANRWVRLVANNAIGWACDRWPRRWLFVPALFLGAASSGIYALTIGFWPLFLGRLLWGIAWAGIWVAGNTIILDVTTEDNRGRWVGYYHTAFFLGVGLGAPVGGVLTDWLGYRPAMGVAAGLALIGALVALILLPETRGERAEVREVGKRGQGEDGEARPRINRRVRWGALGSAIALLGVNRLVMAGILISTLSLFLAQQWGDVVVLGGRSFGIVTVTGIALGMTTLLSMLSASVAGHLSDRMRNRWRTAVLSLLCGVVGFGLLAYGSTTLIFLGLPLASLASGGNQSLSTALVGDLAEWRLRGRMLGIFHTIGDLGSAIGPPLAYGLIAAGGTTRTNYALCVLFSALMLFVALYWTTYKSASVEKHALR